jgi:serine/threonine protein kinase
MSLQIGQQLGSYEITLLLGTGGMGEVYRARDTKLKREVAVKVLPDEFTLDQERVARFQREAEVLASLNHTNIAVIHDVQEADGSRFLIMELVEGETLADRIARGPIPLDEALAIAKQICEALQAIDADQRCCELVRRTEAACAGALAENRTDRNLNFLKQK